MRMLKERIMKLLFFISAALAASVLLGILALLLFYGGQAFKDVSPLGFFFGSEWNPDAYGEPKYGIIPLAVGSLLTTVIALAIAAPTGIASALFISEKLEGKLKMFVKTFIEILAGFPSVVIGFFGLMVISPIITKIFNVYSGLGLLNAGILLGMMSLPTIISISEDALMAVPSSYREAALGLGISALSWEFLTQPPRNGMKEGGILPCIVGTVYLAFVSFLFSVPVGIAAGIYFAEYASDNILTKLMRSAIRSLAGIPSVVYGLFGVAVFVELFNFGPSVLASGLTLGLMNFPWIIATSEESIRAVPVSFREGALALGATKWETIRHNVIPYSLTGMATGVLLAIARAVGEVAPILFTGVTFYLKHLPKYPLDKFMALPYHLFGLVTQHEEIETVRPIAFGTALVLLLMVLALDMAAFYLRSRFLKTKRW